VQFLQICFAQRAHLKSMKTSRMTIFSSVPTHRRQTLQRITLAAALSVAVAIAATPSHAFFWINPTWPGIKQTVRDKYPQQRVVTTGELKALLDAPASPSKPTLIDVRSQLEFDDGQLAGAMHAETVNATEALLVATKVSRDAPIIIYCSVGYRSAAIVDGLARRGYTDVRNYEGSLFEWANSGLPVYQGTKKVSAVHPYDRTWGKLLRRELWSREP
jgi:rhodanese-related sulfurtransferase